MTDRVASATRVPLETWAPIHPAATAASRGEIDLPPAGGDGRPRSAALAEALSRANRAWGNPVDDELSAWLEGGEVVVTGQQPGLLGGPLLTLVKAAAVAAEVARLRAAGRRAVGFLWLATGDDDLPEMGWGRVAVGEELAEVRESDWRRGDLLGGCAPLGDACASFLEGLRARVPGGHAQDVAELAASCYASGVALGEATMRFLARLLADTGVVLVDALEPELARAGAAVVTKILAELPRCWEALEAGGEQFRGRGWRVPLRISSQKLPVFRRHGNRRETVPTSGGGCPRPVLDEAAAHPERYLPNAWLRPLVQDAALGSTVVFLGGAELAYHVQTCEVRGVAGLSRPEWRLRPHVTIVTSAERRLAGQLRVGPEQLLRPQLPSHALPGRVTRRRLDRLRTALETKVRDVAGAAHDELPALAGDVDATAKKLAATVSWLEGRIDAAATRDAEVEVGRWRRLRAFLRPDGKPQERHLSVLAPLLRLGMAWPAQLATALDPTLAGMQLLYWEEGGPW